MQAGASEPGYAFTGREWDPESGLYYYRARYYAPDFGRFISEDPANFSQGPNPYSYANNRPVLLAARAMRRFGGMMAACAAGFALCVMATEGVAIDKCVAGYAACVTAADIYPATTLYEAAKAYGKCLENAMKKCKR
jgi:RHS repeat-associated protein